MNEYDVGVATSRKIERLSGPNRHDVHLDPRPLLEARKKVAEEARLLGRRRRCNGDVSFLRLDAHDAERAPSSEADRKDTATAYHGNSPSRNWAASREAGSLKNRSAGARSAIR